MRTQKIYLVRRPMPTLIASALGPTKQTSIGMSKRGFDAAWTMACKWLAKETGLPSLDTPEAKAAFVAEHNINLETVRSVR